MHTTEEKEHINMKIDTPNLMRIVSFKWVSMMHGKRSIKEAYAYDRGKRTHKHENRYTQFDANRLF